MLIIIIIIIINYVLWLPYLFTRTAEAMVKESKVKENSNFTKYRRNVRLCSDLFTDLVLPSCLSNLRGDYHNPLPAKLVHTRKINLRRLVICWKTRW